MATPSRSHQDVVARSRLRALEASVLGLLLLGRRRAVASALRVGADPTSAVFAATRSAILHGRLAARSLGADSIVGRFGAGDAPIDLAARVDVERAMQIARRQSEAVAKAVRGARYGGSSQPWRDALKSTEWRLEMVATTEVHQAANSARILSALQVETELGVRLAKEWNAFGDACPVCGLVHGERVPLASAFSNGLTPGAAHPRCRCWVEIIQLH